MFAKVGNHVPEHGGDLLDLGAGTGHMTMRFGRRFDRVVMVDHSREMLEQAREKATQFTSTHVRIELTDAIEFIRRTNDRFDLVTCVGFLHHLGPGEIEVVLRNVRRVLRPEGRAVIVDPVRTTDPEPKLVRWWNRSSLPKLHRYIALAPSPDEAPLELDCLRHAVKSAGLEITYQTRCWEIFDRFGGNALDRMAIPVIDALSGHGGIAWFGVLRR